MSELSTPYRALGFGANGLILIFTILHKRVITKSFRQIDEEVTELLVMKVWGVSKSILSYPIPSCRVKGSIIHSNFDSTSREILHKKFQLILMNIGWEKKLSRSDGRPVGRTVGRSVGRPGRSENLRIKLTQTLSRASVRLGLSLAIYLEPPLVANFFPKKVCIWKDPSPPYMAQLWGFTDFCFGWLP